MDAAKFTRQIATKTMEGLNALNPAVRLEGGAKVRIRMWVGDGHIAFVQGHVVSHSGTGADEVLKIRSSHGGNRQIFFVALNSPDLLGVDILRDFGSRSFLEKGLKQTRGKFKKSGPLYQKGWHHSSATPVVYRSNNQAIAGLLERAVAETVAEDQAVIVAGLDPAAVALAQHISSMVGDIRDAGSNDRIEKLVELMLPATDPIAEVRAKIEVDNANLRTRFLTTVPVFTAADIAAAAGSKASNKSATANRWKTNGQIFAVSQAGRELFPAFQFEQGEPRPIIGKLLAILQPQRSPWETAFWFVSSNPWLDGQAPVDCLDHDERIIAAANHSVESLPN